MTEEGAGMAEEGAGMAEEGAGMTKGGRGNDGRMATTRVAPTVSMLMRVAAAGNHEGCPYAIRQYV